MAASAAMRKPIPLTSAWANLAPWIRAHVHAFDGELSLSQFSHGQSNPTFLLTFADGHQPIVLRKQPAGHILPSAHAVDREYRVLCALHAHSDVPVPRPIAMCDDPLQIGTPFYLMSYVEGRVFVEADLPQLSAPERFAVYHAMCDVLARIHAVDWAGAGLAGFGRPDGYSTRQVKRWQSQVALAAEALGGGALGTLGQLAAWLAERAPAIDASSAAPVLVHGDFRLDNLVFSDHPHLRVAAVLDWELATIGDARADVGYALGGYAQLEEALGGPRAGAAALARLGIPSASEFSVGYSRQRAIAPLPPAERTFFQALAGFRLAAIQLGVLARARAGNASSARAREAGEAYRETAERAWRLAAGSAAAEAASRTASSAGSGGPAAGLAAVHPLEMLPCAFRPAVRELYDRLSAFLLQHVAAAEASAAAELARNTAAGARWRPLETVEGLKRVARGLGLWNAWISPELGQMAAGCCDGVAPGLGLSTLEYAPLAELTGRFGLLAPEALNCSAPDTGNMELLARFADAAQQRTWLRPLLEGEMRSCYAMTEPEVASSDAANLELEMRRCAGPKGEPGYRIRGRKWWVSGAGDPRCQLALVLGRLGAEGAGAHKSHTVLLVPLACPGLVVSRALTVFGYDDAPHGHCELRFEDVWVPAAALLGGEGRGFEMAQARLGPGRVHHCMRALGLAERCLEAMCRRAKTRTAFGELLAHKSSVHDAIADSRAELDCARLLTLSAAHCMDRFGNRTAAQQIALIKLVAPSTACRVIDRAIQLWGGAGVSGDTELAYAYAAVRTLRLADGPDAVHSRTVARVELLKARL